VPLPPPPTGTTKRAADAAPVRDPAPLETAGDAAKGPGEPKVKMAADQTGAMVQVTQDLQSDKIRQDWAGAGGTIPAFEANLGMTIMAKSTTSTSGGYTSTSNMSGVGLNGGFRVAMLSLAPPSYESRDTSWNAWRLGAGMDFGGLGVTMTTGTSTMSASMMSMSLTMTLGFMHAFGSFDSPTDWSGWAVGAEWAPSWQQTSLTIPGQTVGGFYIPQQTTTNSSFNATGFDLFFESGSMKSMAARMGKKARMKMTLFVLPPVGEMPFMMTASLGANWY
jgi:hypothetical protein